LLALVTRLCDHSLCLVEITLPGERLRAGRVRHRCAAGKKRWAEVLIGWVAGERTHELRLIGDRQHRLAHLYIVERRMEVVEAQHRRAAQRSVISTLTAGLAASTGTRSRLGASHQSTSPSASAAAAVEYS